MPTVLPLSVSNLRILDRQQDREVPAGAAKPVLEEKSDTTTDQDGRLSQVFVDISKDHKTSLDETHLDKKDAVPSRTFRLSQLIDLFFCSAVATGSNSPARCKDVYFAHSQAIGLCGRHAGPSNNGIPESGKNQADSSIQDSLLFDTNFEGIPSLDCSDASKYLQHSISSPKATDKMQTKLSPDWATLCSLRDSSLICSHALGSGFALVRFDASGKPTMFARSEGESQLGAETAVVLPVNEGDLLLVGSDGVFRGLSDEELLDVVGKTATTNGNRRVSPKELAAAIVGRAKAKTEGNDDITVVTAWIALNI